MSLWVWTRFTCTFVRFDILSRFKHSTRTSTFTWKPTKKNKKIVRRILCVVWPIHRHRDEHDADRMSTKSKPNHFCQGKDAFERMNFLYQAANEMAGKSRVLSSYYGNMCKSISKKSVLRLWVWHCLRHFGFRLPYMYFDSLIFREPDIKRTICKRCALILKPGVSADLDIDGEQNGKTKVCKIKCLQCGQVKRFVMNKNYDLWMDNEKSTKQLIVLETSAKETQGKCPKWLLSDEVVLVLIRITVRRRPDQCNAG